MPFPKSASAPIKTAIEPEPGIPKSKVGTSPPPSLALFELSGPITPRTSPLPNSDFSLLVCIVCPYAIQSTTEPPSPGITPTMTPMIEHLADNHLLRHQSLMPKSHPPPSACRSEIALSCLNRAIISGTAKTPKPTITNLRPSVRYG